MAKFIDVLCLVGFALESLLYGVYCVLFLASLYIFYTVRKQGANQVIAVLNVLLFVSCTLHYALEFDHYYTWLEATGVDGFANETNKLFVADCVVSVTDFIGDLILIYRCWVIWSKSPWVAILPLLCAAGGLICSAVVGHLVVGTHAAEVSPAIIPLGLASFILPLCANVLVTGLIAGRIWWVSRGVSLYALSTKSTTRKATSIIIESGVLYFIAQFVFVIVYGLGHPSAVVMVDVVTQIYGIASVLIIIHVGLDLSYEQTTKTPLSGLAWVRSATTDGCRTLGVSGDVSRTRTPEDLEMMPYNASKLKPVDQNSSLGYAV